MDGLKDEYCRTHKWKWKPPFLHISCTVYLSFMLFNVRYGDKATVNIVQSWRGPEINAFTLFTTTPLGQLTSTDLNIPSWQDQPRTMLTFISLHLNCRLRRGKKAISLSPRLPWERGSHSLSSVSSAESLICCVRLAVGQQDNVSEKMQRWQPMTTTAHILLPTMTPQIKTEEGFFTSCWLEIYAFFFLNIETNFIRSRDFEQRQHAVAADTMVTSNQCYCSARKGVAFKMRSWTSPTEENLFK